MRTQSEVRIGSLFAGAGGLTRAVESAFANTSLAWLSEYDPAANTVLKARFPGVPNHGDITRIDWHSVEPVEIMDGGSPCQDVSIAGKRAGLTEGTRSNLWTSMREGIAVLRPRIVIWENVGGVTSARASSSVEPCPGCVGGASAVQLRALGRVLGDLAELGYDAEWVSLRASRIGACHGRRRFFVVAHAPGDPWWQLLRDDDAIAHLLPTPAARDWRGYGPGQLNRNSPGMEAIAHLLPTPAALDATHYRLQGDTQSSRSLPALAIRGELGPLLPTPEAKLATSGPDYARAGRPGSGANDLTTVVALLPTPTAADARSSGGGYNGQTNTTLTDATARRRDQFGQYAAAIASHEHLAGRPAPAPTETGPKGGQRLNPRFVEWMMCWPDGWVTDVVGRVPALKICGNGVVTPQAETGIRMCADMARQWA